MQLLQLPGLWEMLPGLGSEAGKSSFGLGNIIFWAVIILFFISLSELPKLYFRENIGKRALNMFGVVVACTLCLAWAGICVWIFLIFFSEKSVTYEYGYAAYEITQSYILKVIFSAIFLLPAAGIFGYAAFHFLHKGMNEHFSAKAENAQSWQQLEYRGDSIKLRPFVDERVPQGIIWRKFEPLRYFNMAILLFFFYPAVGIPLLITLLSFRLNEWYHVYYKWERTKDTYLSMKIEMQKAGLYFNQTDITEAPCKVTVDE